MYGVADISGKLKKGECFVQFTQNCENSEESYRRVRHQPRRHKMTVLPDGTKLTVMKSPTYHPGDVRILKHRYIPELSHLNDVIVFPVSGLDRPHQHEIHESDLDGDEYFVTWDKRLIPQKEAKPLPPTEKIIRDDDRVPPDGITVDLIIEQFAKCDPKMGLIDRKV